MPFPHDLGTRTQPAWTAILQTLSDGHWHTHADLADRGREALEAAR